MRWLVRAALPLCLVAVLAFPAGAGAQTTRISGMTLLASSPTSAPHRMSDLAFWGNRAYVGTYTGFRIYDIANPAAPTLLTDFPCSATPGGASQGDVSVWNTGSRTLLFRSVDAPQTSPDCARNPTAGSAPGWEGIDIFDVTNPAAPTHIKGVATDCGSHTHTLVPDLRNNRVLLYIGSYPAAAVSSTPTPYGNTCERLVAGGAQGHDKISVVEVPLGAPQNASVIAEVKLGLQGDFTGVPGFKGCHDISVFVPLRIAAGACLTEGVILDISNPANLTIKNRIVNPAIDFCARRAPDAPPATGQPSPNPLCLWHSATFTWDGKYVVFGDEAGGGGSPECSSEDPPNRGAFWLHRVSSPTFPIASFKIPRIQPHLAAAWQNCTAHIMNFVPINDRLVLPSSWYSGGTSVINWTNLASPSEMAHFEVEPGAAGSSDAAQTNTWTSYWYNDFIYTNDGGNTPPANNGGQRGFEVFSLDVPWRTQAWNLPRFNPQTQENLIACSGRARATRLRARRSAQVHVTLSVLGGQPVVGAKVTVRGGGVNLARRTNGSGQATFAFRPRRAGTLRVTAPDTWNMLGCEARFRIRPAAAGGRVGGAALTGRLG
jgi:hypothetical protein